MMVSLCGAGEEDLPARALRVARFEIMLLDYSSYMENMGS
jgi:hypothetical protein